MAVSRGRDPDDTAAAALIVDARERVLAGWCRGADARDAAGRPVNAWDPAARSWSLLGAIVAAADLPPAPTRATLVPLRKALGALAAVIDELSLTAWNDDPARDQRTVVATLDAAHRICVAPR